MSGGKSASAAGTESRTGHHHVPEWLHGLLVVALSLYSRYKTQTRAVKVRPTYHRVSGPDYAIVAELVFRLGLNRTSVGLSISTIALKRLERGGLLRRADYLTLEQFIRRCNGRIGEAIRCCEEAIRLAEMDGHANDDFAD